MALVEWGDRRELREQAARLATENTKLRGDLEQWKRRATNAVHAATIAQAAYDSRADELAKAMLMASTHPAYGTAREQELAGQVERLTAEVDRLTAQLAKGAA